MSKPQAKKSKKPKEGTPGTPARRTYLLLRGVINRLERNRTFSQGLRDTLAQVAMSPSWESGFAVMYRVEQHKLRALFDSVNLEMTSSKTLDTYDTKALQRARDAIIKCVDVSSREVVLGVKPLMRGRSSPQKVGTAIRTYIHVLDGRPAVFVGDKFEYAELGKTLHFETPVSMQQVRSQQNAVLRAHVKAGGDRKELEARISWVSLKMSRPLLTKAKDNGNEDDRTVDRGSPGTDA